MIRKLSLIRTSFLWSTAISLVFASWVFSADPATDRFFWMGSGNLHIKSMRNGEEARVSLLNHDGSLNDAAFSVIDRVFGFPTSERVEHISPRMLFMLSYFSDLLAPGQLIYLESGYRSPEYNDKIRKKGANAARTSSHIDGMAIDFWIEGVDGKELWELIRSKNCCGVGHYGGKTVHLDSGRPRFWEAATSGTRTKEPDYNRHIYISSDFDRYKPGDTMRISISGASDFRFGIGPELSFYELAEAETVSAKVPLKTSGGSDCFMINSRKASRFLFITVPQELAAGRYKVKAEFCRRPFAQMPEQVFSNVIELH